MQAERRLDNPTLVAKKNGRRLVTAAAIGLLALLAVAAVLVYLDQRAG